MVSFADKSKRLLKTLRQMCFWLSLVMMRGKTLALVVLEVREVLGLEDFGEISTAEQLGRNAKSL